MSDDLSTKRWKRPRTRNDLIERLMKYEWGRQLDILAYMRQFKTWDELWKDLERRETGPAYEPSPTEKFAAAMDKAATEYCEANKNGGIAELEDAPERTGGPNTPVEAALIEGSNPSPPTEDVAASLDRIEQIITDAALEDEERYTRGELLGIDLGTEPDKTVYWHGGQPYVLADFKEPFPWDEVTAATFTEIRPMEPIEVKSAVEDLNRRVEDDFSRANGSLGPESFIYGNEKPKPDVDKMRNVTPVKKLLPEKTD